MGIVYTKDLLPGMVVASDIITLSNQLIIAANTTLTDFLIEQLKTNSISEVNVVGPITSVPSGNESYSEKITHSKNFRVFKEKFSDNTEILHGAMDDLLSDKPVDTNKLIAQTGDMIPARATGFLPSQITRLFGFNVNSFSSRVTIFSPSIARLTQIALPSR